MLKLIIAALLVFAYPPQNGYCADAEKVPAKTRTLKDLTSLAIEKGEDDTVRENTANSLGLGKKEIPVKVLYFYEEVSPDGFEHAYQVIIDGSKPKDLVWEMSKKTKSDDKETIEGYAYLVSPDGKCKNAIRAHGIVGAVEHTKLALDKNTKQLFQKEFKYWTRDTVGLEWSK
jgi:hypothetical protein